METLNSAAGRIVESLQICQSALEFNEMEVGGPIEPLSASQLSSHHQSLNGDFKSPKQDKSCIEFGLVEQGSRCCFVLPDKTGGSTRAPTSSLVSVFIAAISGLE